jgi:hypothetical protein
MNEGFFAKLLIVALTTATLTASTEAQAAGIQMLPPTDFSGNVCAGANAGLLEWDGATSIKCVPMTIGDSNGFVGIGTTAPEANLHIVGSTSLGGVLSYEALFDAVGGLGPGGIGIGQITASHTPAIQTFYNANLALLPNGGNVGIGTPSPLVNLHIVGSTSYGESGISYDAFFDMAGGVGPGGLGIGRYTTTNTPVIQTFYNENLALLPNGGNVGIQTASPSYTLDVNGTAYATGAAGALSDRRHKTDIQPLAVDALDAVAKLKPVTFLWKDPKDDGMKGRQIGFIAQDVQPVLPDVVLTARDADKTLGLKYNSLIPVLTKALQEFKFEFDTDHSTLAKLKTDNDNLRSELNAANNNLKTEVDELRHEVAELKGKSRVQ